MARFTMHDFRTSSSHCFGCINVRCVTLALAIGYLIMHVLGMGLLVFMSVNLEDMSRAMEPNVSSSTQLVQMTHQLLEIQPVQTYLAKAAVEDEKSITVVNALVRHTKINVTTWITNFVVKMPSSLAAGVPSRSDLNLAIIFYAINDVVSILAICGVVKSLSHCLIPFFISQALDFILSILTVSGLNLDGITAKEDILVNSSAAGSEFSNMEWDQQALFVTGQIFRMSMKLYLLLVVWKCIKHIKYENVRVAREERQEKWVECLLKGGYVLTEPVPPPAYQTDNESSNGGSMDGLPSYSA